MTNGIETDETKIHEETRYSVETNHLPMNIKDGKIKVGAQSSPKNLAGLLVAVIKERGKAELQTIGASSQNQAIKAIAIARGIVAPNGRDLICSPSFIDIDINGEDRTGIRLVVEFRPE
jgi:stage V sporulation protein S